MASPNLDFASTNSDIASMLAFYENIDRCDEANSTNNASPPEQTLRPLFSVKEFGKKKAIPYFCTGSKLTALPGTAVNFTLTGAPIRSVVKISLRYEDEDWAETPVKCNLCAHAALKCKIKDHKDANFCVSCKNDDLAISFDYVDLHPTGFIKVPSDGNLDFAVSFRCLNSCLSHTNFTKAYRSLEMKLMDCDGNVVKEAKWIARICKSPKRDHQMRMGIKRTIKQEFGVNGICKQLKQEPEEGHITLEIGEEHDDVISRNSQFLDSIPCESSKKTILDPYKLNSEICFDRGFQNSVDGNDAMGIVPGQSSQLGCSTEALFQSSKKEDIPVQLNSEVFQQTASTVNAYQPMSNGHQIEQLSAPKHEPAAPVPTMMVNMIDAGDKKFVQDLVLRLGGTVADINITPIQFQ